MANSSCTRVFGTLGEIRHGAVPYEHPFDAHGKIPRSRLRDLDWSGLPTHWMFVGG